MKPTASGKAAKDKYLCDSAPQTKNPAGQKQLLPVLRRRALLLSALILLLCLSACLTILFHQKKPADRLTACIYQDGQLIKSIDLHAVTTPYTFTVPASCGGSNTIEVRPDAIGIIDADCPDKLCVSTGFVDSTLLPIVCLPHRLVIQLETDAQTQPDVISY